MGPTLKVSMTWQGLNDKIHKARKSIQNLEMKITKVGKMVINLGKKYS